MDIEIKSQPFTQEKLEKIKQDLDSQKLRRFAAIVNHQNLKYSHNALIAWAKNSLSQELVKRLKTKHYVTHIYLRKTHPLWQFGLYTMLHAKSQKELDSYIQKLLQLFGGCKFRVLTTLKEFKKSSFIPTKT